MSITPMHIILHGLLPNGLLFSSDLKSNGKDVSERTLTKLRLYTLFFCDIVCESYQLMT